MSFVRLVWFSVRNTCQDLWRYGFTALGGLTLILILVVPAMVTWLVGWIYADVLNGYWWGLGFGGVVNLGLMGLLVFVKATDTRGDPEGRSLWSLYKDGKI